MCKDSNEYLIVRNNNILPLIVGLYAKTPRGSCDRDRLIIAKPGNYMVTIDQYNSQNDNNQKDENAILRFYISETRIPIPNTIVVQFVLGYSLSSLLVSSELEQQRKRCRGH